MLDGMKKLFRTPADQAKRKLYQGFSEARMTAQCRLRVRMKVILNRKVL